MLPLPFGLEEVISNREDEVEQNPNWDQSFTSNSPSRVNAKAAVHPSCGPWKVAVAPETTPIPGL